MFFSMMYAALDRFGRDVVVMKEDDRHFRITLPVAVSNQFYGWVFGLGKTARIIGPESAKESVKKALADIAARYEYKDIERGSSLLWEEPLKACTFLSIAVV